jgi:phenylalanyl-tRNA synthetase beta chain
VGMGFSEMLNTYLTNEETNFGDMRIKDIDSHLSQYKFDYIKLKNAKAQSVTMMRSLILPSLLKNLGISRHEKMPQRLFELDMVFYLSKKVPKEDYHLAAVSADPRSNFNYMKGVVEALAYFMKLDYRIEKYEHESFIKGRCAMISVGGEGIGVFGELHPEVLSNFGIEEPTAAFEINLSQIAE